jgi:hypothetical protein
VIAATPPPQQVHNLVLNIRSFDSLARQIWGGDAALVTLQIDETLIRIDRNRSKPARLAREIRTLQKHGSTALQTLDPTGSAIAEDAISALKINLAKFRAILKRITS